MDHISIEDRLITPRVLIADDERNQQQLLTYNLEKAGFSVIQANDGQKALDLAEETIPDIIILDWMMPNMSGIDVCRSLRGDCRNQTNSCHYAQRKR